ncbi:MAG: 2OG-Fe(II) oxygenase [Gammaproteobacteria bacterium]
MSAICMMLSTAANPAPNDGVLGVGFAENVFTREECQQIITLSQSTEFSTGTLGGGEQFNPVVRNSQTTTIDPRPEARWVYEKMDAAVGSANQGFQFDLNGFEAFQVASYSGGGHYDWHMDLGKGPTSTRKLGISLQLSESNDYAGGDIEFRGGGAPPVAPREIGTLIVFPAFMHHRVTPVTEGTRHSLVAWIHGTPFR